MCAMGCSGLAPTSGTARAASALTQVAGVLVACYLLTAQGERPGRGAPRYAHGMYPPLADPPTLQR